ncbi:MAG TPA: alkaline phosphatase family protein, partial [Actinomycetota bacterium]|nr:alkaline phosphatase family protein [Actinomycetota bacterium]
EDMIGYTQHSRKTLPGYWAYADRFVLADHFFTSMFGPTFPEHLYTVAAQSYGIVDNKTNTDTEGNYCDDPRSSRSASAWRTSRVRTCARSCGWRRTSPRRCPDS